MNKKLLKKYLVGDFTIRRLIRSLAFIYCCILIFALVWSDRMIFQPQPCSYSDGAGIIKLQMDGGPAISAIYLTNSASKYTVLYNHANAEDLGDIRTFLEKYCSQGFSVLSYDYPGYGTNPGRPTTRNACRAAETALSYLTEQQGIPSENIIIHGRSVGGGPALYLAHAHDVAGLIAESTFVTAFRVLTRIPMTPFDKFRNISLISKVNCPILVIHGRDDDTIPFWHGQKLFESAKNPKMSCWLDGATHDSMPEEAEEEYWTAIASFSKLAGSHPAITNAEPGRTSDEYHRPPDIAGEKPATTLK